MEIGFVFACSKSPEKNVDWRSMYFSAKFRLENLDLRDGFRNKYRNWKSLDSISYCLQDMISYKLIHEEGSTPLESSLIYLNKDNMACGDLYPEGDANDANDFLEPICSQNSFHPLKCPQPKDLTGFYVGVSTINLNYRR
jgi:hypothetical protein